MAPDGESLGPFKGQWVRNDTDMCKHFSDAGLSIHKETENTMLHADYLPVKIWALYKKETVVSETDSIPPLEFFIDSEVAESLQREFA